MNKIFCVIISCFLFMACGDFLQEQSQQYVYAASCSDLDELLIGVAYMESSPSYGNVSGNSKYYPWLYVMDDDAEEYVYLTSFDNNVPIMRLRTFHGWYREPFLSEKTGKIEEDGTWLRMYASINYANVIISQVDQYTEDPEDTRRRVKGEAQFLRGAYYFLLNNMYAKPYVKETADSDLGVPLKLSEYVEDKYYARTSNAAVYRQIVTDLKNAADNLAGIQQNTIYRVNELAVHTLLSRVYLYMGEWQLALDECDHVIKQGCQLWNLNQCKITNDDTRDFMLSKASPEILFTQGSSAGSQLMESNGVFSGPYIVSSELYGLYQKYEAEGVTDLRAKAYFKELAGKHMGHYFIRKSPAIPTKVNVFDNFVIRAAEVYLNKAEAEAMLGKSEAIPTLETLLVNRFKGKIPNIKGLTGKALVGFIREERRRELCFECHRWFDLRRYAVNPMYPEAKAITHSIYAQGANPAQYEGTLRLEPYPGDGGWVMPIPQFEIEFNKGALLPNEERPDRHL